MGILKLLGREKKVEETEESMSDIGKTPEAVATDFIEDLAERVGSPQVNVTEKEFRLIAELLGRDIEDLKGSEAKKLPNEIRDIYRVSQDNLGSMVLTGPQKAEAQHTVQVVLDHLYDVGLLKYE